jgi:hypothetical protein
MLASLSLSLGHASLSGSSAPASPDNPARSPSAARRNHQEEGLGQLMQVPRPEVGHDALGDLVQRLGELTVEHGREQLLASAPVQVPRALAHPGPARCATSSIVTRVHPYLSSSSAAASRMRSPASRALVQPSSLDHRIGS